MFEHPETGRPSAACQEQAAGGQASQSGEDEIVFDFEEWSLLAKVDPEAFEARRRQAIDRLLSQAPASQRRMCLILQREIDAERQRAGDPQAAFLAIAKMMCQQLAFLGEALTSLNDALQNFARAAALGEGRLRLR